MQEKPTRTVSSLDIHLQKFIQTGNRDQLLVGLYPETRQYCLRRLHRDPDVIGDFIVMFFEEKVYTVIEEFISREHPSFPAFYLLCVRNAFNNFIRKQRRSEIDILPLQYDPLDPGSQLVTGIENPGASADRNRYPGFWHRLEEGLANLHPMDVILFKLYHSIPLGRADLRVLVQDFGVDRTIHILQSIDERKRYRDRRLLVAEDRMNRYYRRASRSDLSLKSDRRQADLQSYLNRYWAHSIFALAALLGMSRQLAGFRLRRTSLLLRKYLGAFHPDYHCEEVI